MLVTEELAQTQWCPFSRYSRAEEPGANRWGNALNPATCRCIATSCMMWREDDERVDYGYCGLAGKP
jgi:hypothetical protein